MGQVGTSEWTELHAKIALLVGEAMVTLADEETIK